MTFSNHPSAKRIETYKGIPLYLDTIKVKPGTTPGFIAEYGDDFFGHTNGFCGRYAADVIARCKRDIDAQLSGGWGVGSPAAIARRSSN